LLEPQAWQIDAEVFPKMRFFGRLAECPRLANVNLLIPVLALAAAFGSLQIFHQLRARALRALATSWDFRYLGPPPPKWWWGRTGHIVSAPIPTGLRITRVWNVIEGKKDGFTILIFDVILGESRGSQPCTLIACQTEENPFETLASDTRVLNTQGWTVLYGVWFLWFCWTMRVKRLDRVIIELKMR